MDIKQYIQDTGKRARNASRIMAKADSATKNKALLKIADLIMGSQTQLLEANALDLAAGKANGLDTALLDRLELTPDRIKAMADGLRQVADLPDPIGEISPMDEMLLESRSGECVYPWALSASFMNHVPM